MAESFPTSQNDYKTQLRKMKSSQDHSSSEDQKLWGLLEMLDRANTTSQKLAILGLIQKKSY
jgi:hypothetical protein